MGKANVTLHLDNSGRIDGFHRRRHPVEKWIYPQNHECLPHFPIFDAKNLDYWPFIISEFAYVQQVVMCN